MGQLWQPHAIVDPYNQRTSYVYDSMARLIAVENALGFRATQLYDSQGRLAADINPLGFRTSYTYDTNSQLLQVQDPLGHITTTLHDSVNRLTASRPPGQSHQLYIRRGWPSGPYYKSDRRDHNAGLRRE